MLDEMFDSDQTFINTILAHPTYFFLFLQILRSVKPIQHFIQHAKFMMLDEMLDRFNSAFNPHLVEEANCFPLFTL